MSETSKAAETMKKAADHATRSSQAAMEAAGKATRDTIQETMGNGSERAREATHTLTETVAETANVTAGLSSQAAEQGREVLLMGMRTAADVGGRVADIGFGRGHHFLSSATHAMDIYRDASERSAEHAQALFSSCLTFGRGLQAMQQAWLELADQTMEKAAQKPRDLFHCKNMVEVAEVQRDIYIGAINRAVESTTRMLEMAGRTAQDAVRPLQSNHH
ncbi:MAG TPA: phasin family protein [Rhodopila sp.]|jgi:hypothetical protein|nr:phasin family protein [Rhodopila sp.]